MPIIQLQVSIEVDSLDSSLPQEKLLEYVRVGVQRALLRESQCISLLPPSAASTRERISTVLLGVTAPPAP